MSENASTEAFEGQKPVPGPSPCVQGAQSATYPHKTKKDLSKTPQIRGISRAPSFWPLGERVTAIQVHTTAEAKLVEKRLEGRRIAYSCVGPQLDVFRVNRSLQYGDGWIKSLLPNAERVWGGETGESEIQSPAPGQVAGMNKEL